MSKDNKRQPDVSPSMRDQLEGVDDAAKSAIITRAVEDQNLLLKARELVNYGDPTFAIADGRVSDRFGKKSVPAIACVVPIALLGIRFNVTIWGRLENQTDGQEIKFEASMPKDIKPIDTDSRDRLLAHVENAAWRWGNPVELLDAAGKVMIDADTKKPIMVGSEYLKATASAESALLGRRGAVVGQLGRPRLVKRVSVVTDVAPSRT